MAWDYLVSQLIREIRLSVVISVPKDLTGTPTGDFHPISSCPCRAYTGRCSGLRYASPLNSGVIAHRSLKIFAKNENYFPLWEQKRPYFGMVAQIRKKPPTAWYVGFPKRRQSDHFLTIFSFIKVQILETGKNYGRTVSL